jgi:hypothetical protein
MPSDRSISGDAQVHPRSASAATTHPRDGTKRKLRAPPLAPLQGLPGPPAAAEALTKAGSSDGKFRMYQTDAMHAAVGSGLDGRPSAANMRAAVTLLSASVVWDTSGTPGRVGPAAGPRKTAVPPPSERLFGGPLPGMPLDGRTVEFEPDAYRRCR